MIQKFNVLCQVSALKDSSVKDNNKKGVILSH